jgi:hypothetical protein
MKSLFRILFILVASSQSASADKLVPAFVSGNWDGQAYYDDNGIFNFCSIYGEYRSGISITFAMHPDGTWKIGFGQPGGFSNQVGSRLNFYVDGQFIYGAPADSNNQSLVLTLPSTVELFHKLRVGHALKIVTPGGTADFDLTGTSAALLEMMACVKQHSGANIAAYSSGLEPAAGSSPTPTLDDPNRISRDQALTYAANLLSAANVSGYQFLPYEETKVMGDVVWTLPDNGIGALSILTNLNEPIDVDHLSASALKDDSISCKGDFVSGKKTPRQIGSVKISRSFSACSEGSDSYYYDYSWINLSSSTFVRLVNGRVGIAAGETTPQDSENLTERSEEAVLYVALPQ